MKLSANLQFYGSCAALNGIEKSVITRAEDIILMIAKGEDLASACLNISDVDMEEVSKAVGTQIHGYYVGIQKILNRLF